MSEYTPKAKSNAGGELRSLFIGLLVLGACLGTVALLIALVKAVFVGGSMFFGASVG